MKFHIGTVLSITTGKLLSPDNITGVYEILNYMTDDKLFTHQLGRAGEECAPWLLKRHPFLSNIPVDHINHENWKDELDKIVEQYGEELEVHPIPKDEHRNIDPLTEAEDMIGKDKIIVINREEGCQ